MAKKEKELALKICDILYNKKGKDIVLLDVSNISGFADYFVIATGNSKKHTSALADEIEKKLDEYGEFLNHKEGHNEGTWILLDYLDIIVHIFIEDERNFYDIERIWKGAKYVELDIDME
ncbi:ribosome silencing factor [Paramaledivibacter caminithermalis]|jgi:ribosome-associated protein|uniref:Ribosomal silencing factor RsfS n=1 Tax=Paramaledivibacter caminithermalis (strain DSM 15212 / CIP 107654 / DViRD3) TaxID=1121301 RepID=A0A1M6MG83_PARC5|nr:ribosome silencing factor [Paramaledivibacter caminithermalis]SHJ82482.1 ribosome-associated protein [Paramaledivibacter caminithermalis DSM 15212]